MSPRRRPASSCSRSRCGRYQASAISISAGQPASAGVQAAPGFGEAGPLLAGGRWRREGTQRGGRIGGGVHRLEQAGRGRRADARDQLRDAKAGHAPARVLHEAQQRQQVLDVRGLEELEPAVLDEGMLRRASSSSSPALWLEVRNSTACCFSASAPRGGPAPGRQPIAPAAPRPAPAPVAAGRPRACPVHSCLACRSAAAAITAFDTSRIGCVER